MTTLMSLVEYQNLCTNFFKYPLDSEDSIAQHVGYMSIKDFSEWSNIVYRNYYDMCNKPIRDFVASVRGDYNFSEEAVDPLKNEENQVILNQYRDIFNMTCDEKFTNLSFVQNKNKEWRKMLELEQKENALNVEVDGKKFKAIALCEVLWSGWESDNKAWIVMDEGKSKLVATNHGQTFFTEASFLEGKIEEYKQAIKESEELLKLLKT